MPEDAVIPLWVRENAARTLDSPRLQPPTPIIEERGRLRSWDGVSAATECGPAVYLLDGPTFPVADGGSAVKAGLLRSVAAQRPLWGLAALTSADSVDAYAGLLSGTAWLSPADYYGAGLRAALTSFRAPLVIADSLETATRLVTTATPRIVFLLMDFYPTLTLARGAPPEAVDLSWVRMTQVVRDPRVTVIARTEEDREAVRWLRPANSVLLHRGADLDDARPVRVDPAGPAALLCNFYYPPNIAGLRRLAAAAPAQSSFRLIGGISAQLRTEVEEGSAARFTFLGVRADLNDAFAGAACGVVPLETGGGSSIKVLDYAARRLPVVATTVGARGLTATLRGALTVVPKVEDLPAAIAALEPRTALLLAERALVEVDRSYRTPPLDVLEVLQ